MQGWLWRSNKKEVLKTPLEGQTSSEPSGREFRNEANGSLGKGWPIRLTSDSRKTEHMRVCVCVCGCACTRTHMSERDTKIGV